MENTETLTAAGIKVGPGSVEMTEDQFRAAVLTRLAELQQAVTELHAYVQKIEQEAHASMEGLMSPDKMMDMAGKLFGGGL